MRRIFQRKSVSSALSPVCPLFFSFCNFLLYCYFFQLSVFLSKFYFLFDGTLGCFAVVFGFASSRGNSQLHLYILFFFLSFKLYRNFLGFFVKFYCLKNRKKNFDESSALFFHGGEIKCVCVWVCFVVNVCFQSLRGWEFFLFKTKYFYSRWTKFCIAFDFKFLTLRYFVRNP